MAVLQFKVFLGGRMVKVWKSRKVELSEVAIHKLRGLFGDHSFFCC
jgi:hypothetical protein